MDVWIYAAHEGDGARGEATAARRRWRRYEVGSGLALVRSQAAEVALEPLAEQQDQAVPFELARILAVDRRRAALLGNASAEVRLNGRAPLPVAVLEHRDEITLSGGTLRFAAFIDAGPYAMRHAGYRCARCKSVIKSGSVVRACPACDALYHSSESVAELGDGAAPCPPCYDYEPECRSCLRTWASMRWTPEDEDAGC